MSKFLGSGALSGLMLDLGLLKIICGSFFSPYFQPLRGVLTLRGPIQIPFLTLWGKANLPKLSIAFIITILTSNILPESAPDPGFVFQMQYEEIHGHYYFRVTTLQTNNLPIYVCYTHQNWEGIQSILIYKLAKILENLKLI